MTTLQRLWINIQLLFRDYATCKLFRLEEFGKPKLGMESQGMDVIGDRYIIQASDNTGKNASIVLLDMNKKKIIREFDLGINCHVNNINYVAPYLYISECKNEHRCLVYSYLSPQLSANHISTLTYSGRHYGNCKNAFDWFVHDNFIYSYGMTDVDGEVEVLKFKKPSWKAMFYTYHDKDILTSFKVQGCYVYQGTKVVNGKLYALSELDADKYPTLLKIINLDTGEVERSIKIKGLGELEALGKYEDGIIVVNCATNPTYTFVKLKEK